MSLLEAPTYTLPIIEDKRTGEFVFSPVWLAWFLDLNKSLGSGVGSARRINTTPPLTGGGNLSTDLTLALPAAAGGSDGYLKGTDWTIFNGKMNTPSPAPLAGTKVYYVSDTSGGALTRKLTFTNGILTGET